MVEVVKCEKGHYYDRSVYARCPHCEAGTQAVRKTTGYRNEVSRYAMEYLKEQRGGERAPQDDSVTEAWPQGAGQGERIPIWEKHPEREEQRDVFQEKFPDIQNQETVFIGGFPDREGSGVSRMESPGRSGQEPVSHGEFPGRSGQEAVSRGGFLDRSSQDSVSRGESSDRKKMESVPRRTEDDEKDGKTIGFSPGNQKNYMVTGWLVCVDGPHKGCSFNLYYGFNTIGYSRSNRISLLEDTSVARKVHCSVVYEDRKNCFYLVPEEGQETYLNDQRLTEASNLKSEDRISIGKTQLVFIAFCGGERKWEKELMRKSAKY